MHPTLDGELADASLLPQHPRVSVLMITYNQQDYIAAALQSAVDQVTSFPYEIVVGEDCSTDRTREVCETFQKRHPDKLRVLGSSRNLGFQQNFMRTASACRGDYVAVLEGDDIWIDPHKLELQVDKLDAEPAVNACITRARRLLPDGTEEAAPEWDRGPEPRIIRIPELASRDGMIAPTASLMARRDALLALPRWLEDAPVLDSFLFLGLTGTKGILYLPRETVLYRMSAEGSWSVSFDHKPREARVAYARRMLGCYEQSVASFGLAHADLRLRLSSLHLLLAREALSRGSWLEGLRHVANLDPRFVVERTLHRLTRG